MHREFSKTEKEFIGEFFLRLEILTADEIEKILHWQKKMPNRLFGEVGVEKGLLTDEELNRFLEENRN